MTSRPPFQPASVTLKQVKSMSALPEDSVQDGSIDAQLHQQQLAGNDQLQSAQPTPSISESSTRKRTHFKNTFSISTDLTSESSFSPSRLCSLPHWQNEVQRSFTLSGRSSLIVSSLSDFVSTTIHRAVSSAVWELPVLILILMHKATTIIASMNHLIPVSHSQPVLHSSY